MGEQQGGLWGLPASRASLGPSREEGWPGGSRTLAPTPTLTALSMLLAVSPNSSDLGSAISGV